MLIHSFCSPGVSAYVEVWSSNRTENYSKTFAQQLLDMGAKVSKTFNKQVTHVVFKEGHLATWRKAQKTGVKLVSVLWVEKCREAGAHIDESLFPAIYTNEGLPLLIKKHKCMQPKDFVEKTPENDKRLQKKLDLMAKELDIQKTATETDIPVLLFEDDGSLAYSPTNKIKDQCSAMEKRIKDMKEKRENLSPTASQMSQISTLNSTQPGYGESLGVTSSASALLPEEHISDSLNSSFDDIWGNCKYKNQKPASAESDIYVSTPASEYSLLSSSDQGNLTPKSSNRKHLNKKLILQHPLKGELFPKKRKSEVSPNLNQSGEDTLTSASVSTKSSFLQEKGLSHITLSPEMVQLEAAAVTTGNQSDSLVSSEDSINMPLVDINIPVDTRDCSVRYKIRGKPKREKYNMKLTTSSCKVGSENEFLVAMTTRNKSSDIEEASYDDFFSPSNLKKSEMQVRHFPLQVQQKSPSAPEVSCKRDFLSHKQDRLFEGSDKQCTALIKKRKRTVKTSGVSTESGCKITECSESTISVTLNCMSGGVATETAEALGSSPLNKLPQNIQKISCRTSVNSCPQATGKLLHSSENSKMQHHDKLKMLGQLNSKTDYHVEGKQCLSKTRLPEENTVLMAPDSLKSGKMGAVEPKEHPLTFPDSTNTEKSTGEKKEILLKKCSPSIENEISVCEATDVSCEVFNENKNKPSGESKKTGRIKKPTRTLVMTSMSSEKQCAIIQVVNKLGGFLFSDDVCETTTHVVTGSPRRTLNVMLGIARGCWIVCDEWVLWSLECGHWISEEPYELSANFPAAPICRLQRHLSSGRYQQDLFSSQPVMFISLASQPPCDKLSELVQLCGGKICKTLRQAKIYIGEYLGKKQPEIKYLSEKWILDSVTQHRICPLENYMFQQ
ncbi:microcephalin isoform X1 [Malaclemys terrapin pileata]|uniref:microcephalin isoform X1 n=2 Tax=Malaclemys terrapin pileata TaxID=2991368 RepID=UPI0023A8D971|nr:microcephalin isoform X1 [Malaclemys terrapin pileata]